MKTFEPTFTKKVIQELKNEPAVTIHTTHGNYIGSIDKFGSVNLVGYLRFINPRTNHRMNYENRTVKVEEINKITIG